MVPSPPPMQEGGDDFCVQVMGAGAGTPAQSTAVWVFAAWSSLGPQAQTRLLYACSTRMNTHARECACMHHAYRCTSCRCAHPPRSRRWAAPPRRSCPHMQTHPHACTCMRMRMHAHLIRMRAKRIRRSRWPLTRQPARQAAGGGRRRRACSELGGHDPEVARAALTHVLRRRAHVGVCGQVHAQVARVEGRARLEGDIHLG